MVKLPKETPVLTTTTNSIVVHPTLESVGKNLATSYQQLSSDASSDIQSNLEQLESNIPAATASSQSEKAAQIAIVAAADIPVARGTAVHHDGHTAPSVPGQSTIKIEEPHIKQEAESPNAGILINTENPILRQEGLMPVKESQAPPHRVSIATAESQASSKTPAAAEENNSDRGDRDNALTQGTNGKDQENRVPQPSAELMAAYKGLFRTYCGQTPAIDSKDISVALRQAEAIIKVAELYGSVPTVRPHLGNCLLEFGLNIHRAVLQDPPRWLLLSLYLESSLIFKEAAVHVIGNLGYWPWPTVSLKDMPDDLAGLLNSKIDKLKRLLADVERTLFMTSINVKGEDVLLAPTDRRTINTWYVTQLWKQWFIRAVSQDKTPKPTGRTDGTKYRAIAKGVDAYLPLETVTEHIKTFREPSRLTRWDKQTIEEDLKMFKTFAQKQVEELCINNSMLSVEEAGIEHLTCATVDDIDISWLQQGVSGAEDCISH